MCDNHVPLDPLLQHVLTQVYLVSENPGISQSSIDSIQLCIRLQRQIGNIPRALEIFLRVVRTREGQVSTLFR